MSATVPAVGDVIQGPWPAKPEPAATEQPEVPPAYRPRWASERYHSPEERRATIMRAKPECKVCGRMFHPRGFIPNDLVCLDCRHDMLHQGPADPPADPALF